MAEKHISHVEHRANQGAAVGLGVGAASGYRVGSKLQKAGLKGISRGGMAAKLAIPHGVAGAAIGAGIGVGELMHRKSQHKGIDNK